MVRILFSLPVHERPDILHGQIENINYFCPNSIILIHVSRGSIHLLESFKINCEFENVIFNPTSLDTIWNAGLMHIHVANFLFALEEKIDFDKIMIISSNELLVKPGLADYVGKYDAGAQTEVYDSVTDWLVFRDEILQSPGMRGFLNALDLPVYFGGQTEGQFANRELFAQAAKLYALNFPMGPVGYPSEEVILPTVVARHSLSGNNVSLPVTLCNYCTNLQIEPSIVDQIRSGTGTIFARRAPRTLRSPHIGASVLDTVFSVKRVPRDDCEIRRYILNLMI